MGRMLGHESYFPGLGSLDGATETPNRQKVASCAAPEATSDTVAGEGWGGAPGRHGGMRAPGQLGGMGAPGQKGRDMEGPQGLWGW